MSRRKGASAVIVLLCLGLVAGCGNSDDGVTQEDVENAIQRVEDQQKLKDLQDEVRQLKQEAKKDDKSERGSATAGQGDGYYEEGSGGQLSSCSDGVEAGPNTSCAFAMNVAGEYGSNPGANSISAYSPATGEHYTLTCMTSADGTVCTGGNGALVHLP